MVFLQESYLETLYTLQAESLPSQYCGDKPKLMSTVIIDII